MTQIYRRCDPHAGVFNREYSDQLAMRFQLFNDYDALKRLADNAAFSAKRQMEWIKKHGNRRIIALDDFDHEHEKA